MNRSVGLYARISEDPNDTRAGVERQREDGLLVAKARGWEIAREYIDNDLSAYKRQVVRPQFEQMLLDLAAGEIDGIVAYDLDRFVRQPRDLERAIDIYEGGKGGLVFATVQGDVNLQTSDGRTMARVMVAFANKSSADTGRRVARKHLEIAKSGRPVGGFRPFGWKDDKATLDPRESRLVREAAAELTAGAALRAIARRWNEAGVTTTQGNPWSSQTLKQYMSSPRLVGHRVYKRRVLKDDHGRPVKGLWEPMLTEEEFDRLQLVITRPERRSRIPKKGLRRYLLTGLIRCGRCSSPMYGNAQYKGRHYYVCQGDGSHMNTISGKATDRLIGRLVVGKMEREAVEGQPSTEWEGQAELDEAVAKIDKLMSAFLDGTLSEDVAFPRVKALEEQVADMRKGRTQWLDATAGPAIHKLSLDEWDALDTDEQRAYAEKMLDAVLVKPLSRRTGNRIDPERIVPVWKRREGQPVLVAVPA